MLSDVFNNLDIWNTPLILVIMLLQDNNILKKLTSRIMDSLTGFQDNFKVDDLIFQLVWLDMCMSRGHFSLSKQD